MPGGMTPEFSDLLPSLYGLVWHSGSTVPHLGLYPSKMRKAEGSTTAYCRVASSSWHCTDILIRCYHLYYVWGSRSREVIRNMPKVTWQRSFKSQIMAIDGIMAIENFHIWYEVEIYCFSPKGLVAPVFPIALKCSHDHTDIPLMHGSSCTWISFAR